MLGVTDELEDLKAGPMRTQLGPGDMMLMVTDGYWEAMNPVGEQWGMDAVHDVVRSLRDRPCTEIVDALERSALGFMGTSPTRDDRTAILVRRTG